MNSLAKSMPCDTLGLVQIHCQVVIPLIGLLLLLMAPLHVLAATEQCPQWVGDEIQLCVQPVAEFARTLNQQQAAEQQQQQTASSSIGSEFGTALQWPTKMGGQVFRELCRLINDFELCVEGYKNKCRRHITINLIEASYGFLCNEGYETFMASAECLMELDQQPSVKGCHDRTLREIEEANREENGTVAVKLDRMCNALNYFAECVRPPIRRNCGMDAWRVIFRVLKDTSRTLMPMCHFDEYEKEEALEAANTAPVKQSEEIPTPAPPQNVLNPGGEKSVVNRPSGGKSTTSGPVTDNWEKWKESDEEYGEDEGGEGMGVHIETDSSQHLHFGSQQGQRSGTNSNQHTPMMITLFLTLFTLYKLF